MSQRRPVILCVLDGCGVEKDPHHNAVAMAKTPILDHLLKTCPHSLLQASEEHVGLPAGQMGNSEVGHTALGVGRVVWQDLMRLNVAFESGDFQRNKDLLRFIERLRQTGGTCHLMGLLSDGGVHAHQTHLETLAAYLAQQDIPVAFHAFLDGRDTPPQSGKDYLVRWIHRFADIPRVQLATLCGRYYAMDRDQRWERTAKAYGALVTGETPRFQDPLQVLTDSYALGISDEFAVPCAATSYGNMQEGDGLLMGNFRADRIRQILHALLDPEFTGFERPKRAAFCAATGLMSYGEKLDHLCPPLYPPVDVQDSLGEILSRAGKTQLRLAETEKYAHVTFFFNGGSEMVYPGEKRILVPSPKVPTYDLQPEMSANALTDQLIKALQSQEFDFILVNYANTDMVGHTGDLKATIQAVETIDRCLGRVVEALHPVHGILLITSDHGNAEKMYNPETHGPHTAHTCNPVPLIGVNFPPFIAGLEKGSLTDVAPTILALMDLPKPQAMTGKSLLEVVL